MLSKHEIIRDIVVVGETFLILAMLGNIAKNQSNMDGRFIGQGRVDVIPPTTLDSEISLEDLVAMGRACNTGEGYVVCSENETCAQSFDPIDFGEVTEIPDGVPAEYVSYVCKSK